TTALNAHGMVLPRPSRTRPTNLPASSTIWSKHGSPLTTPSLRSLKFVITSVASENSNLRQSKWVTRSCRLMPKTQFLEREKDSRIDFGVHLPDTDRSIQGGAMSLGSFIRKQFIDIIQYTEDADGVLSYRFPMQDFEIQYGAQLTVRESQAALFVN